MPERGELEWNPAAYVVRRIAEIGYQIRSAYVEAQLQQDAESWYDYYAMLRAMFLEIGAYMDEEDRDDIEERFEGVQKFFQTDETVDAAIPKLEKIDQELREELIEIGLDVPSKTKLDPENAFVQGAR